jgi:hypothetical protein
MVVEICLLLITLRYLACELAYVYFICPFEVAPCLIASDSSSALNEKFRYSHHNYSQFSWDIPGK